MFMRALVSVTALGFLASGCSTALTHATHPATTLALVWPSGGCCRPIGWRAPEVIVYANGLTIVGADAGSVLLPPFRTVQLRGVALDTLLDALDRDSSFWDLGDRVDLAPGAFDAPGYWITIALPTRVKTVFVYGRSWEEAGTSFAPVALRALYDRVAAPQSVAWRPWAPDSIEVHLVPIPKDGCVHPSEFRSTTWPEELPPPPGQALPVDSIVYRLPSRYYGIIVEQRDLHGNDSCRPLNRAGRDWLLGYRLLFPSEDQWP
jgi:hypothetical protein